MKTTQTRELLTDYKWQVVEEDYTDNSGHEHTARFIKHPGAVVILPIDESGKIIFARQYRHPIKKWILELPAGTIDSNEEPILCAKRELQEEVHLSAENWADIGILTPTPGFCDEIQYCFVARELSASVLAGDSDEFIEPMPLTKEQVQDKIASGEIGDAKTIALFYRSILLGKL